MASVQYPIRGRTATAIAASVESGVLRGRLGPDAALPPVRALAAELGVAPGTVAAAYRALRDRGVVVTAGRRGTRIRSRPPLALRTGGSPAPPSVVDLSTGQPDPELLPVLPSLPTAGRRAAAPPAPVSDRLLAVARPRMAADGIPLDAVTVTGGALDAVERLLAAHLVPGDRVAVEDPCWAHLLDLLAALGLRPLPVPVDAAGPVPAALAAALDSGARAVVVTARAQNPTGAAVTAARAAELRRVLRAHPATLLIEDDHAAELAGVALRPLAGATRSWAFVRSVSKPYGPDLRLAVVAADDATAGRMEGRMRLGAGWVSWLLQDLVAELWSSSVAAAAVAAAAATYDARRTALVDGLAAAGVPASGGTGLNVWVPVRDETAVVAGLLGAGWLVAAGTRFRVASGAGIRISVSGLADDAVPRLVAAVADATRGGPRPPAGFAA